MAKFLEVDYFEWINVDDIHKIDVWYAMDDDTTEVKILLKDNRKEHFFLGGKFDAEGVITEIKKLTIEL